MFMQSLEKALKQFARDNLEGGEGSDAAIAQGFREDPCGLILQMMDSCLEWEPLPGETRAPVDEETLRKAKAEKAKADKAKAEKAKADKAKADKAKADKAKADKAKADKNK